MCGECRWTRTVAAELIPSENTHQPAMRDAEILALGYFVVVGVAALALSRRRAGAPIAAGWSAAGVVVTATASLAPTVLRDWWLLVALPLAYWAPARLAGTPHERLERWLQSIDDRLGLTPPDPSRARLAGVRLFPGLSDGAGGTARHHLQQPWDGGGILARALCGRVAVLRVAAADSHEAAARRFCCQHRPPAGRHSSSDAPTSGSSRRSAMRGTHCRAATRPAPRLSP